MECEFEEKQYEFPLNKELVEGHNIFVPGPVFESILGMDAALFTRNLRFWMLWFSWRYFLPPWRRGVHLTRELWDGLKEDLDSDSFPRFKFNLFIQHKRPEHVSSPNGREYGHWGQAYFRYDIKDEQQRILYELQGRVSSNALVVYACASFWRYVELWQFVEQGRLVENSNFVQPRDVQGHHRYTFIERGNFGIACSEPSKVENLDIREVMSKMREAKTEFKSNSQFIFSLSQQFLEVVKSLPEDFQKTYKSLTTFIEVPEHELARSMATISVFTYLTNLTWGIGYEK